MGFSNAKISEADIFCLDNEDGVAMVEASLVLSLFFTIIIVTVYFFILTLQLTTAHYEIQNTLRDVSVGPRSGESVEQLSQRFISNLLSRLEQRRIHVAPQSIIVRNEVSEVRIPASSTISASQIFRSESFVTVELTIDIFPESKEGKSIFGTIMPRPRVFTGMRMAAY